MSTLLPRHISDVLAGFLSPNCDPDSCTDVSAIFSLDDICEGSSFLLLDRLNEESPGVLVEVKKLYEGPGPHEKIYVIAGAVYDVSAHVNGVRVERYSRIPFEGRLPFMITTTAFEENSVYRLH